MASRCNSNHAGTSVSLSQALSPAAAKLDRLTKLPACFVSRKLQEFLLECSLSYLSLVQPVEPSFKGDTRTTLSVAIAAVLASAPEALRAYLEHMIWLSSLRRKTISVEQAVSCHAPSQTILQSVQHYEI